MTDTYLHPETIAEHGNLAVEHTAGALVGFRQVFGPSWIARYMASIYRMLIIQGTDALSLEKTTGTASATLRYTLTDDEPDIP